MCHESGCVPGVPRQGRTMSQLGSEQVVSLRGEQVLWEIRFTERGRKSIQCPVSSGWRDSDLLDMAATAGRNAFDDQI